MSDLPHPVEPPKETSRSAAPLVLDHLLLGLGTFGAAVVIFGSLAPWFQIGGGLLTPSTCSFPSPLFAPLATLFAIISLAGTIGRRATMTLAGGVCALVAVLSGTIDRWTCFDCVCTPFTHYQGPTIGWTMTLLGAALMIASGIASMRRPRREWFEP